MFDHSALSNLMMDTKIAAAHLAAGINKQGKFPDEVAGHLIAAQEQLRDIVAQMHLLRLHLNETPDVPPSRGILAANMPQIAAE